MDLRISNCRGFVEIEAPRCAPQNLRFLENQEVGEILLNPEMGQKVRFGNEDGHEMDKVLAIRAENGSVHTNFFVRIQP